MAILVSPIVRSWNFDITRSEKAMVDNIDNRMEIFESEHHVSTWVPHKLTQKTSVRKFQLRIDPFQKSIFRADFRWNAHQLGWYSARISLPLPHCTLGNNFATRPAELTTIIRYCCSTIFGQHAQLLLCREIKPQVRTSEYLRNWQCAIDTITLWWCHAIVILYTLV